MMRKLRKIERYYYFFLHTKKNQIARRVISLFSKPVSHKLISLIKEKPIDIQVNLFQIQSNSSDELIIDIERNQFVFLNQMFSFQDSIKWSNNSQSDLWNFNLNYFDFLSNLIYQHGITRNQTLLLKGQDLVHDWINASIVYDKIMWAPYTISLRLLNWISFYSFLIRHKYLESIPRKILISIQKQVLYLKMNLELDVKGNHLFENLKTIILTEYFLGNVRLVDIYVKKINSVLKEQVLQDGCHFEKSTSYHIIVLNGILDILSIVKYQLDSVSQLRGYASLMMSFYKKICYSDKDYPLFNDSNYTMTERIVGNSLTEKSKLLMNVDHSKVKRLNQSSDYIVFHNHRLRLTMDLGCLGPNYLMAHSHNDIFNFELLVENQKIITDTGVFEYEDGKNRFYSRCTKAHNTVQVNGFEQSDVWSSFRSGYRPTKFKIQSFMAQNYQLFKGAYKYKTKYSHERNFYITATDTIVIVDKIFSKKIYNVSSYLHFDPEVKVEQKGNHFELKKDSLNLYLYSFELESSLSTRNVKLLLTDYYPFFGTRVKRQSVVNESMSRRIGYLITSSKLSSVVMDDTLITINYENGQIEDLETL